MQLERVENMALKKQITEAFEARYGEPPTALVRAPGRVNLMGGHTGYTGGYVLTTAVDRYVMIALRPREDNKIEAHTLWDEGIVQLDGGKLDALESQKGAGFLHAMAWALNTEGLMLQGWEGVMATDIPANVDMAADAALMIAVGRALAETSGYKYEAQATANIADKGATDYLGRRSMLADLYAVALAEANSVLLLDMRTLNVEKMAFSPEARVLMLDTDVAPDLALDEIVRTRTEECATAARAYKVSHLRDLSMSRFEKDADSLEDALSKRARHFLTENGRTILAGEMMRSNALATVGKLMNDSHVSLRDEYEIGHAPAEAMLTCVMEQPNVFGARWSGFGGGVVALVRDFSADTVSKLVVPCYAKAGFGEGRAVVLHPAGHVEVMV